MRAKKMNTFTGETRKKRIPLAKALSQILHAMGKIIHKLFVFSSGPIFTRSSDRYILPEVKEFYEKILREQFILDGCKSDRENMHQDVQNLRRSFKKAVKEASEEYASVENG